MQLFNHLGKNGRTLSIACLCAAFAVAAFTSQAQDSAEYLIGARQPALSPDGKTLAFVYRGDIWSVPAEGGRATPLTQHVEMDANPVWSPDGKWIAFSSARNGNEDIFVMPAQGGSPRQMTFSSENEVPTGWSPDSSEILFTATRDGKGPGIFSVNMELETRKYAEDFTKLSYPAFSPDGKTIVHGRFGFPWIRPRYYGSGAMQIALIDVASGERKALVDDSKQHLWSKFMPSGQEILTVTIGEQSPGVPLLDEIGKTNEKIEETPARTPNLWIFNLQGEGRQITEYAGDAVRAPSIAFETGDIAFEYDIDLYLLRNGSQTPEKVLIEAAVDAKTNKRRLMRFDSNSVEELAVTDDGSTIFFGLRSEIWSIPTKKPGGVADRTANIAKRLTDWVGEDSNFIVQPGKNPTKLYFLSDRQKNLRLYELDLESDEINCLWDREDDILDPRFSPDGTAIAFWVSGAEGGLYRLNLEDRSLYRLVELPASYFYANGGTTFSWSPDGRWIAYTRQTPRGARNIFIIGSEGGSPYNVTQLYAMHEAPTWSADGKFLYFYSNRDGAGIYRLPLRESTAQLDDFDLKFEPTTNKVNVSIDFNRINRRIVRHSTASTSQMLASPTGDLVVILNGEVALISYDGKSIRTVTSGGGKGNLQIAPAAKKVYFTNGAGEVYGRLIQDNAPLEKVTFIANFERDVEAERQAAFAQFWRNFKRGFYDGNMHGRDWDAIRARYERLLPTIDTSEEFGVLLNRMTGELESSHSEIGTRKENPTPSPSTPKLGFIIDYNWRGPGLRVAEVPPNMPGDYEATRIKAGEYIMQINGTDVRADETLYQTINNKHRDFTFMVSERPSTNETRLVKYALPTSSWGSILYENKIEKNADIASKASDDRLAYIHIAAMGPSDQSRFEREVYDRVIGKDALIIDVRGNRGGNIADTLIGWLMRKPHGYVKPRDEAIHTVPDRSWDKPIIALCDQESYSNGELFTTAFRVNKLGLVVGMPTPGYVIWTYGMGLVDGTSARMPLSGAWRLDGTPTEGMGEEPDIHVELTGEDYRLGRDPQLERAIHEILKQLDGEPLE